MPLVGQGIYDNFLDLYELTIAGSVVHVYVDRFDAAREDVDPVPGFTLAEGALEANSSASAIRQHARDRATKLIG